MTAKERLALRIAKRIVERAGADEAIVPTLAERLTEAVSALAGGAPVRGIVGVGPLTPEGVEVTVTGDGVTEDEARRVAPEVCKQLDPTRLWGDAIHSEWCEDGQHWHVVVNDQGPVAFDGQVH